MPHTSRAALGLLVLLVGGLLAPVVPTLPAAAQSTPQAGPPAVASTLVPALPRGLHRGAQVQGVGSTGLLLREEPPGGGWEWPGRWVRPDGTSVPAPGGDGTQVLGDRLVHVRGAVPAVVDVWPVGGPWREVPVPSGYGYLSATGDGLLLVGPAGPGRLSLLRYDGGPVEPLSDVTLQRPMEAAGGVTSDATGALLIAPGSGYRYVDTATGRVSPLPEGAQSPVLGADVVAWWQGPGALGSASRGSGELGAPVVRPVPPDTDRERSVLAPLGAGLVLSPRYGARSPQPGPVLVVDPDGGVRVLAKQGFGAVPAADGGLYVTDVSGSSTRVVRLDASGDLAQVLVDLPPVPATTSAVAVDGDRLVVLDDSAVAGAVHERQVSSEGLGPVRRLGEGATAYDSYGCRNLVERPCRPLVAGGGSTAWGRYDSRTGTSWHVRTDDGRAVELRSEGHGLVDVDQRWLVSTRYGTLPQRLVDLSDPALAERRPIEADEAAVTVQDGVSTAGWAPDGRYLFRRDLATGRAALHEVVVPPCGRGLGGVLQTAGSWVLGEVPGCGRVAVDLSGRSPARLLPEPDLVLGNGVAVGQTDGAVRWYDLTAPVADPAQPLVPTVLGEGTQVAVTRQAGPQAVVWVAPDGVRVARLPVVAPALPAHPVGPATVPDPPAGVVVRGGDASATVSWSAPPPEQQVGRWTVTASPGGASVSVTGRARSAVVPGLTNGRSYAFAVTGRNAVGTSPAAPAMSATPLSAPVAPLGLRVAEDPWTGTVEVDWWAYEDPSAAPATAFRVQVGPVSRTLPATAERAEIVVPARGSHVVTVTAVDARGLSTSASLPAQPLGRAPRVDRVAVTGTDGQLWTRAGEGAYKALGGQLRGAPAVVQAGGETWYVGVGTGGRLYVRTERLGWSALAPLSTVCSAVSATAASGTLVVGCRGSNGHLWAGRAPLVAGRLPAVPALKDLGGVLLAGTGPTVVPASGGLFVVVGSDRALWSRTATRSFARLPGARPLCWGSPAISATGVFWGCANPDGLIVPVDGGRFLNVPGALTGRSGAVLDPDGTLRLYVTGKDGVVRVATRQPGREPTALSSAGGRGSGGVAAARLP